MQTAFGSACGIDEPDAGGCHLYEQRIVERRDDGPAERRPRIEPNPRATRRTIRRKTTIIGREAVRGVFGCHPALDREPVHLHRRLIAEADLRVGQFHTLRDQNLRANDVVAGDDFRDGMFDLNSRVDFDEVKLIGVCIVKEFDRARVVEADRAADLNCGIENRFAHIGREVRRGSEFDDLLVPSLDRTIAFVEVNQSAVFVAEELDLDMLRALNELFEKDIGNAERGGRLLLCGLDGIREFVGGIHRSHPAAPAAHRRLHHHGIAEFLRQHFRIVDRRHRLVTARENRHVRELCNRACRDFIAELAENRRVRADERDICFVAGPREVRILGQEPIARVDRIDADVFGERHDTGNVEIRTNRLAGFAHAIRFVGLEPVQCEAVFVRVNRHGADAEFVRRTEHADGDFTTIRHEQFLERLRRYARHRQSSTRVVVCVDDTNSSNNRKPMKRRQKREDFGQAERHRRCYGKRVEYEGKLRGRRK